MRHWLFESAGMALSKKQLDCSKLGGFEDKRTSEEPIGWVNLKSPWKVYEKNQKDPSSSRQGGATKTLDFIGQKLPVGNTQFLFFFELLFFDVLFQFALFLWVRPIGFKIVELGQGLWHLRFQIEIMLESFRESWIQHFQVMALRTATTRLKATPTQFVP